MKKLLVLLVVALMAMMAFAGCSPDECEVCGAKDVDTTKVEVDGEEAYVCETCEGLVNLGKAFAGMA